MLKFARAEFYRFGRYWLTWALLVLLIGILFVQVNDKIGDLAELETEIETGVTADSGESLTPMQIEGNRYLVELLRQDLRYPALIGTAARLSTNFGWFLVILYTAVMGGEDFGRRTLRSILSRGVRRIDYIATRCLTIWLATGVAIAVITILATAAGPWVHTQVTDDPLSLEGLGEALLTVLRTWLVTLPFIVATLFWAVLGRNAGPAMGVGIGLRAFELFSGFALPVFALLSDHSDQVPLIFRLEVAIWRVTLGYSAEVFLSWGNFQVLDPALIAIALGIDGGDSMSVDPWRAVAIMAGYTILFFGLTAWVLHRRDVTYEA